MKASGDGRRVRASRASPCRRRHDDLGSQRRQCLAGSCDARLEERPVEVEAADDSVDSVDTRESAGVGDDVDDARVTAAGEGDEPFAGHVDDERLVIEDQRIGLPCPAPTRLMEREAASKGLVRSTSPVTRTRRTESSVVVPR